MRFSSLFRRAVTRLYWAPRFAAIGRRTTLFRPLLVSNPEYIHVGERTLIRDHARLEVVLRPDVAVRPRLSIGSNVNIEQGVHIICQCEVVIEDDVSITPYCVIVDTDHPFDEPDRPPKIGGRLNARADSRVRIGQGSFIGAHSIILPDVDIGRCCVVGAGSVVTRSVPDYCLVSGSPAKVLRRFNLGTRAWEAVSS